MTIERLENLHRRLGLIVEHIGNCQHCQDAMAKKHPRGSDGMYKATREVYGRCPVAPPEGSL